MAIVAMAGPAMNFFLAWLAALVLLEVSNDIAGQFLFYFILTNLVLGLFNLLPIPPLDGSHVMRIATGMTHETYANFARFGFIIIIVLINIPLVSGVLNIVTYGTRDLLAQIFGVH